MTGAEKIIEKILEQARAEAEAQRSRTKDRVDQIARQALEDGAAERQKIMEQAQSEAVEARRRIATVGEMEMRKDRLAMERQVVEMAFAGAMRRLAALPRDQYRAWMMHLALGAAQGGETAVVGLEESTLDADFWAQVNQELVRQGRPGGIALSPEREQIAGGFVLVDPRGVEVNCTFEAMLRSARPQLETPVVGILTESVGQ